MDKETRGHSIQEIEGCFSLQGTKVAENLKSLCGFLYIRTFWAKVQAQACFGSVQWLSHVRLFATPWTAVRQTSLSITSSQSLLKLMSIESVMPTIQPSHPLSSLLLPPSIFPSIRVFSKESVLTRWPKYWSLSFSISPSNEIQD